MGKNDSPTEALTKIEKESEKVIASETTKLYTSLLQVSPVDSGYFRSSWFMRKINKLNWRISNSTSYASILAQGRRNVDGQFYGSIQWAGGLSPMLEKTNNNLNRRLNGIRE